MWSMIRHASFSSTFSSAAGAAAAAPEPAAAAGAAALPAPPDGTEASLVDPSAINYCRYNISKSVASYAPNASVGGVPR